MEHDMQAAQLVTVEQARAALGIGRSTFRTLVRSGELPVVWVRGCRRVRTTDLAAFIDCLPEQRQVK